MSADSNELFDLGAQQLKPKHRLIATFAVHGARAACAGRLASSAIALLAALPEINTHGLMVVNSRLAKAMLAACVPLEALGFRPLRRA